MDHDEKTIYEHIIAEYRQALADTQQKLVVMNARYAVQAELLASAMAGAANGEEGS